MAETCEQQERGEGTGSKVRRKHGVCASEEVYSVVPQLNRSRRTDPENPEP